MSFTDALKFIKACEFLQKQGFGVQIYEGANVISGMLNGFRAEFKVSNEEVIQLAEKRGWQP